MFLKDCTSWNGPTLGQFIKNFSQFEGSMPGKSVRGPPPEEEGVSETSDELIATPILHPPVPWEGRRWRIFTSEVKPRSAY